MPTASIISTINIVILSAGLHVLQTVLDYMYVTCGPDHHRQCTRLPRRLKLDTRPLGRDKARGRLVSATKLQLGNLLGGGDRFEAQHEITAAVTVDIRGRVILFEFEAECQLFRAQVGHKFV